MRFADLLRCPHCNDSAFEILEHTGKCATCAREYRLAYRVLDLAPPPDKTEPNLTQRIMETEFYAKYYEEHMRPKLTRFISPRRMSSEYQLSSRFLDLADAERVIDIACGTGNYTRHFANILREDSLLVGADLSWSMLKNASEYADAEGLNDRIFWTRVDAINLPFSTGAFDRVHCAGALHFMNDVDQALTEFVRVCEPGGIVVVGTFVRGRGALKRIAKRIGTQITQFRFFNLRSFRKRLDLHGLTIIEESLEGDALTVKAVRRH